MNLKKKKKQGMKMIFGCPGIPIASRTHPRDRCHLKAVRLPVTDPRLPIEIGSYNMDHAYGIHVRNQWLK